MAVRSRRGSFGLQPRVAPNVGGQIVQLAREYVAKRDAMIMDAWRSGGTFEGKKATDDMVLGYWKERGKDLDPGGTDYEQTKNQVTQLEYAVAQSKASVLHAQGKMSDTAYAQFFLNWAKKIPANSEFYRSLQRDAAGLIEGAKAKSRAAGERAKVEAFNNFVKSTTAKDIAIGEAMTAAVNALSQQTGLSVTGNGPELMELLTKNVEANPGQYRLLLDAIEKGDPNWSGKLTPAYFANNINRAAEGYDLIADRAQSAGYVSAYASASQGAATMSLAGQNLKVWPVAASYTATMNTFNRVMNDPTSSQMDKSAAAAAASARLMTLTQSEGIDAGARTMIEADAQRLMGQDAGDNPSFGSQMLGRDGVTPAMTMQLGVWAETSKEMQKNPLAWSYAPVDASGQFDPTGKGALGMVPAGSVPPGSQAVMIPGRNGQAVMAMVPIHTVYVNDPNNPNGAPQKAGFQLSYKVGGKTIEMWGYQDAQGNNQWSLSSPLSEGATYGADGKGDVYVTAKANTATDPIAIAAQIDAKYGTNLAAQLQSQKDADMPLGGITVTMNSAKEKKGTSSQTQEFSYANGVFTATTTTNTLDPKSGQVLSSQKTPIDIPVSSPQQSAFSVSRLTAGAYNGVTFDSPLQASVEAATSTQTSDQINKFANDPAFQAAFLAQTMTTLRTQNPMDPRILEAWKKITTPKPLGGTDPARMMTAAERKDLNLPGSSAASAYQGQLTVNFGKAGELRLPGLPSYMNQNVNAPKLGDAAANMFNGLSNMLPGLGLGVPAQQAMGSPAPTITGATPAPAPLSSVNTSSGTIPTALVDVKLPEPLKTGGGGGGGAGGTTGPKAV